MAHVMRLVRLALGGLLSLAACGQAPAAEPSKAPPASLKTQHHYARAASLQQAVLARPTLALLDDEGQALVVQLAHAQTCLAHRTNDTALVESTGVLLDAYLALHHEHGQEPSRRTRRKIEQAREDLDDVRAGRGDAELLGCESVRPRYTRVNAEYHLRTSRGGCRSSRGCRSVPGGVIR